MKLFRKGLSILLALSMLLCMLPLSISAAGEPATLVYQGEEYRLIAEAYVDVYANGVPYLFVAKYNDVYYALGSDLGAVPLTLSNDVLSAQAELAVLTTVPTDGNSSLNYSLPLQVNGGKYLKTSTGNNLTLSDTAPDPYCGWAISDGDIRCFIGGESWSTKHYLVLPDGLQFDLSSSAPSSPILVYQKVCDHAGKTDYPAVEATCTQPGCEAHSFCPACGSWLNAAGERSYDGGGWSALYWENDFVILPTGHRYVDGACVNDPDHTARSYELVTSDDMIVTGNQYRYVLVSEDGKVLGVDQRTEYDANAVTGAVISNDVLTLDNSSDPAGVYAAEFVLSEFEPEDEGMTLPEDGSKLYVMVTETSRVLIAIGELSMPYDDQGDAKYPIGLSVSNSTVSLRTWMYGDWGQPAAYDSTEGFMIGETANVKLYRSSASGCDHPNKTLVTGHAPSCTEGGWEDYYICDDCGVLLDKNGTASEAYTFSDFYCCPALGHDYDAATGVCSRCGEKAPVYEQITDVSEILPDRRYVIVENETGKVLDVPRPVVSGENYLIPELTGTTISSVALSRRYRTIYSSGGAAFLLTDPLASRRSSETGYLPIVEGNLVFMPDYSGVFPNPLQFCDQSVAQMAASHPKTPSPGDNELPIVTLDPEDTEGEEASGEQHLYFSFLSNGDVVIRYFDSPHPFTYDAEQAYGFTQRETSADDDEFTGISLWREVIGELEPDPEPALAVALVTDGAPANDGGFNQAIYDAASAWCAANGCDFKVFVPEEVGEFEVDYDGAIAAAVSAGCTVLLMPGYSMATPAVRNASDYPDVRFILFDVSEYDLQDAAENEEYVIPENIYAAVYKEEQAGYLAGYAAVSLGYRRLAFLGGMALPAVARYGYGFVQGANDAAKTLDCVDALRIDYAYCDQFWPDDTVEAYVEGWYGAGTEIVFACGGGIYASVGEAAQKLGGKVIGVDIDQAAEIDESYGANITVTSAIKGLGATAATQLSKILTDTFVGGLAESLGICSADPAENFVGLSTSTQFGEGFTEEDYAALLANYLRGAFSISDDVENRPVTEIFVDYNCYHGHEWGAPTYVWSDDNSTVTATRVCVNEDYHIESETVAATGEITVPATCAAAGTCVYTAVFANTAFETQTKTVSLPATGIHTPGEPVRENENAASCTAVGGYDTVVYCTVCQAELSREHTEIPALGHAYELTGWNWTGYTAATATFTCRNDASHVETVDARITSVRTEPTAEAAGSVVYTATVSFEGEIYTDSKTEILPALGHDYELAGWRWADDFSAANAIFNDKNGGDALILEAQITYVRTEPTCVAEGKIVYTASVTLVETTYTDVKTAVLAALGHTPGEPVRENETPPTCTDKGGYDTVVYCTVCHAELSREHTEIAALGHTPGEPVRENENAASCTAVGGYDTVVYCTVCHAELSREHTELPALGHDWDEWEYPTTPNCIEGGQMIHVCTRCGATESVNLDPNDYHDWGDPTYVWSEDNSQVTATVVCTRDESHVLTETVLTECTVQLPPTTTSVGIACYVATFINEPFKVQVKEVTIPKLQSFVDVDESAYYAEPVAWAVAQEITNGTSELTFSPESPCTRAQIVTFLWRAAGEPEPTDTDIPFSDVEEGKYYTKAVLWAVQQGITNGYPDGRFGTNDACTRAQVVTFLWRAAGKPAPTVSDNQFQDILPSAYYYDAVQWAVENGVTNGTGEGTFSPDSICTRGQIVTFLWRDLVQNQ